MQENFVAFDNVINTGTGVQQGDTRCLCQTRMPPPRSFFKIVTLIFDLDN